MTWIPIIVMVFMSIIAYKLEYELERCQMKVRLYAYGDCKSGDLCDVEDGWHKKTEIADEKGEIDEP